jgi:hypothetical protein
MPSLSLFEESGITERSATISPCGRYRYWLMRRWSMEPMLYWCMLNPSTADAEADDPTIKKCIGFAKKNGFGAIGVVNLFAWRATEPAELFFNYDIEGPNNDSWISTIPPSGIVVAAWGANAYRPILRYRVNHVISLLDRRLWCVKKTDDRPWHPLYVKYGSLIEL